MAAVLALVITVTNAYWVGGVTIYDEALVDRREQLHQVIIENRLPAGTESWSALGALSVNRRPVTVWATEGVRRLTGRSIAWSYRLVESTALLVVCLLVFSFLNGLMGAPRAVAGLAYFGSITPLVFFLHYFHPWDKPSVATWLLGLLAVTHRRWLALALVLAVGMLVKFDIVLFPILVFLVEFDRSKWRKPALLTAGLLGLTLGIYVLLRLVYPGGEAREVVLIRNVRVFLEMGVTYPPLLALALPAGLAVVGFRHAPHLHRAMAVFAVLQGGVLLLITYFEEFRAEVPLLILLMPCALVGLDTMLNGTQGRTKTARRSKSRGSGLPT